MSQLWWDSNSKTQRLVGHPDSVQCKDQQKAKSHDSGGTRTHNLWMASPGSLEVQCAIHCATEPHKKIFFLVPVHRREVACSVGRKDKVLGSLHNWNAVRKAEALPGPPVQERTCREKHRLRGIAGIRTQDLLFTRQALWPAMPRRPAGSSFLWQQLRGGLQTKSPAALALLCTPVCIPFSEKKNPLSPRWCSSSPSKGTAGIRTRISCLLNRRFNQLSHGASLQAEGGLQTKSTAALALLCNTLAFRSQIEKTLSPRWCSSTPSKGTAEIRTQDLLFTKQAL